MNENFTTSTEPFSVRRFEARDHEAVLALWPAAVMHLQPGSDTIDVLINSVEGEMAIRDAWERGYLKLVVHTNLPPCRLTAALHELGFEYSQERSMGGEHVLEFYQNLYEQPRLSLSEEGHSF
jgi:hypothetical protein